MITQRHLNLSISQRTVLVTVEMVRAAFGVDADSVTAKVEAGELRWVFDVASGDRIQELRIWAREIIAPEFCHTLTLDGAMKEILGTERARWRGTEIQQLLLVSRPTVKKLRDAGALPGDLVNGAFSFCRADVETFLRARLKNNFSPPKAAPLHAMPQSKGTAMPISRVGNSRLTGSPAKISLP